jgi:hypothetical protein
MSDAWKDPAVAGCYDANANADITAQIGGTVGLKADSSRVCVISSLNGTVALTSGQLVNICVQRQGAFVCIGALSINQPTLIMSVDDYGTLIMEQLTYVSPGGAQEVSIAYVRLIQPLD